MLGILIQINTESKLAVKNYGRAFPHSNYSSSKVITDLVNMVVTSDNKFLYLSGNTGIVIKYDIDNMVMAENYGKVTNSMINEIKVSEYGDSLILKDAQSKLAKLGVGGQSNKHIMAGDIFNPNRQNIAFVLFGEKTSNLIVNELK